MQHMHNNAEKLSRITEPNHMRNDSQQKGELKVQNVACTFLYLLTKPKKDQHTWIYPIFKPIYHFKFTKEDALIQTLPK